MRRTPFLFLMLLAFVACEGPAGEAGPMGPTGPQGQQGAQGAIQDAETTVESLVARLAAVEGIVADDTGVVGAWHLKGWCDILIFNSDATANFGDCSDGLPSGRLRGSGTWSVSGATIAISVTSGELELMGDDWHSGTLRWPFSTSGMTLTLNNEYILTRISPSSSN